MDAVLEEVYIYVSCRYNTVINFIIRGPIMDLFLEAERRSGAVSVPAVVGAVKFGPEGDAGSGKGGRYCGDVRRSRQEILIRGGLLLQINTLGI